MKGGGQLVEMPWALGWDGEELTLYFGFDPGSKRIVQVHVGPQTLWCADVLNELAAAIAALVRVRDVETVRAMYAGLGIARGFVTPLLDAWEAAEAKMAAALDERHRAGHLPGGRAGTDG